MPATETNISRRPLEPTAQTLPPGLRRWLLATRPAFLGVTLVAVLLGLASAYADGVLLHPASALVTLLFALVAHAGANVINDYHDRENDALNNERMFPFTGGSRLIQNGVLTPQATARLGYGLLLAVIPAGLWLTTHSAPGLVIIGLAGLLIGWSYSAPPLSLASRGLGEFAIVAGWLLVVAGSDYVQRQTFAALPLAAGLGYALLVANILYINQFPDATADARAGKRTLVVRLGRRRARAGYLVIALLAALCAPLGVLLGVLPAPTLLVLFAVPVSLAATHGLWHHAETPAQLTPAIKLTLTATNLYGLLMALTLVFSKGSS